MPTDLARLREIARVVMRHGFGHLVHRSRPLKDAAVNGPPGTHAAADVSSSAERFARLLEDLGPTFVKLGQILSTRTDLLPPSFIVALSRLQDNVPPLPFDVIRRQVETALGRPLEEVFREFAPESLASASIAQVHAATLASGEEVVVKVQRPAIKDRMTADISLLGTLASVFDAVFEEAGIYKSRLVVQEFEAALMSELDFTLELRNIQAFLALQKDPPLLRVPRVHPALSSRTVLVMERFRGTRLNDLPTDADRRAIAERFIGAAFEQVFVDGLFHGDPHPGNVLVLPDGTVALLDFGLVGRLPRDAQDRLVALLLAVSLRDADSLARLLYRMGEAEERVSLGAFKQDLARLLDRYMGLVLQDIRSQALMRDIMDLTIQHHIRIPREFAVLGKAAVTFEGVMRDLYPQLDVTAVALPYAARLLKERYDPRKLEGGAPRMLLQLIGFAQDLPLQMSQILLDLEAGKLTVRASGPGLEQLARAVRLVGLSVVAAGLVAALTTAAVGELNKLDIRVWGIPVIPAVALAMSFILVGAISTYVLLEGRLPKARLRRLLRFFGDRS
ncbi:MAG: AarF/ABC1/UbiB kinase family protein [Deltaproteobacteria bacterium]|nr:AarF/ABC1/UbiB kinase family protein [Deltaproteobacteria bacterium]